jgi:tRNA U34 5-carboxymethylaminomethyl modifying GTPase MnmE/TrmE
VAELLALLDERVRNRFAAPEGSPTVVNVRQLQAVEIAGSALEEALRSLEAGSAEEIVLVDLYRAATAIGLLTGAITHDEVFHEIFARFCIGK